MLPLLVGFVVFEGLVVFGGFAGAVVPVGFALFPAFVEFVVFEGLSVPEGVAGAVAPVGLAGVVVPVGLAGAVVPVGFAALLSFVDFVVFEDALAAVSLTIPVFFLPQAVKVVNNIVTDNNRIKIFFMVFFLSCYVYPGRPFRKACSFI